MAPVRARPQRALAGPLGRAGPDLRADPTTKRLPQRARPLLPADIYRGTLPTSPSDLPGPGPRGTSRRRPTAGVRMVARLLPASGASCDPQEPDPVLPLLRRARSCRPRPGLTRSGPSPVRPADGPRRRARLWWSTYVPRRHRGCADRRACRPPTGRHHPVVHDNVFIAANSKRPWSAPLEQPTRARLVRSVRGIRGR